MLTHELSVFVRDDERDETQRMYELQKALDQAGIAWDSKYESRDVERIVPDPERPGSWTVDLGSLTATTILIAPEHVEIGRAILANLK